jgi:lipopolysaccharide transport system permease protein
MTEHSVRSEATGLPRILAGAAPVQPTIIKPTHGWAALQLDELWRYRELVYFLTWRDIKVRYKQTAFGAAWALIQPLATMIIFTLIFGRVAHLPSDGVPYALFTFAALVPWTYFAYVLQQSGNSMISNSSMISKVYFPRLALPLSSALGGLMDFCIAFVLLAIMMVFYGIRLQAHIVFLPLFLMLAICTAVGVGLWLSALSVAYRDVKYVIPFLTQIWLYASPVAYAASLVKGKTAIVYALNPMVAVVNGFRWTLLGVGGVPGPSIAPSIGVSLALLLSGLFYFRRMERRFADII